MIIKLFPKHGDEYLIQFDQVVTTISERSLAYILEDKSFSDDDGWKTIKGRDVLALPNKVRVFINNKKMFIHQLQRMAESVDKTREPGQFSL